MRRSILVVSALAVVAAAASAGLILERGHDDPSRPTRLLGRAEPPPTFPKPKILRVDNTSDTLPSSLWPPSVFVPTNVFVRTIGDVHQSVYAGAAGTPDNSPEGDGMIVAWEDSPSSDGQKFSITRGTGALRLTSYSWPKLKFSSTSGRTGTYDVERHELKLDDKSRPRVDCITSPCPNPRP